MQRALGVPVAIDTDVNGAALSEHRWGAAQDQQNVIYLTVGTGIGGGALVHGQLLHGLLHPEMGHILLPHDWQADPYPGFCPYHGDCLEGLAPARPCKRAGVSAPSRCRQDHPAWQLEAHYLALGVVSLSLTLSPQRVLLGGGVMHQQALYPMIREKVPAP